MRICSLSSNATMFPRLTINGFKLVRAVRCSVDIEKCTLINFSS